MFALPKLQFVAIPVKVQAVQPLVPPKEPPASSLIPQLLPDSVTAEILATHKRKKVVDWKTREIVIHVLEECKKEYMNYALTLPLSCTQDRAAMYTGKGLSTIKNVKLEYKKRKEIGQAGKVLKKIRKRQASKTVLDDRDMIIIKNLIRDYYIKNLRVPAARELVPDIMDEIPTYKNKTSFLHVVLKDIGYLRKKYYSKQSVLIENPKVIACRDNYLKTMKDLRIQTENIFYVYECIIDCSFTFHKAWEQKYDCNDALRELNTFTFICAASKSGFLKKAALLRRTDFDRNVRGLGGRLTPEFFERWLKIYLIPNLPERSVIIMEDAPHHNTPKNKPISYYSTKEDMLEYLKQKLVECNENMRRSELYKLIEENKSKHKVYLIDDTLCQHGHKAMRLPPYMVDLSPTQCAMDKIQLNVVESQYNSSFNLQNLLKVLNGFMLSLTQEDWTGFFEKVRLSEEEYWRKDGEFEDAIDQVLLNLRDCVDSGSEESDLNSDSEESD